jgi:trehalose/maltose hydrolase-like predicted phosphorylase
VAEDPEARDWVALADALVDGYDPATGRYEQFAGYFGLEPLRVRDFATPPVAADVLLGPKRVAAAQVIKQPDVLMLHHLVPDEVAPGSLDANLDYYEPRTAHGSSLSPAITAALLARAGRSEPALDVLRTALTLDLDDRTGTTAAGLHLATLGGVWQALLFGFAGARVRGECLHLDPRLPAAWPEFEIRFLALGRHIRLRVDAERAHLWSDGPVRVQLAGSWEIELPGEREMHLSVAQGGK